MQDKISLHMRFTITTERCILAHLLKEDSSPGGLMLEVNPKVIGHLTPSMPVPAPSDFALLGSNPNPQSLGNGFHLTKQQGSWTPRHSCRDWPCERLSLSFL